MTSNNLEADMSEQELAQLMESATTQLEKLLVQRLAKMQEALETERNWTKALAEDVGTLVQENDSLREYIKEANNNMSNIVGNFKI